MICSIQTEIDIVTPNPPWALPKMWLYTEVITADVILLYLRLLLASSFPTSYGHPALRLYNNEVIHLHVQYFWARH